jgi:hypothetical protein
MALVRLNFSGSELIVAPKITSRLMLGSTSPTLPNGCSVGIRRRVMSDNADTFEAIERHNVMITRRIAEYWRRQGIKISPTMEPEVKLGPTGPTVWLSGRGCVAIEAAVSGNQLHG